MICPWTATLSVNAGLALRSEDLCVWIDALHDEKVPDFSTMTPERQEALFASPAFRDPDLICFTHCHPDHYSRTLCARAERTYPDARVALPEPWRPEQIRLSGTETLLTVKGRLFCFRRLTHEGEQYALVPHYGLMIEDEGDRLLVLGDCALQSPEVREWTAGLQIDTAVVTFPWITLPRGRAFLTGELRPRQLVVYHLPLAEDDVYGYRKAARKAADALTRFDSVQLLTEAFQTIEL